MSVPTALSLNLEKPTRGAPMVTPHDQAEACAPHAVHVPVRARPQWRARWGNGLPASACMLPLGFRAGGCGCPLRTSDEGMRAWTGCGKGGRALVLGNYRMWGGHALRTSVCTAHPPGPSRFAEARSGRSSQLRRPIQISPVRAEGLNIKSVGSHLPVERSICGDSPRRRAPGPAFSARGGR